MIPKEHQPQIYYDITTPPEEDGKYSVIIRVGSASTSITERIIFYKKGRWMAGDWQAPIVWRNLYPVEIAKYKGT